MKQPSRSFHGATAAAVFAGLMGAGVMDVVMTLVRASGARLNELVPLAGGIYGALGLLAALVTGWAVGTALGSIPGGPRALGADDALDRNVAAALLAGLVGVVALAAGMAASQALFVGQMASRRLAVIASAGMVLAVAPLALVFALAARRPAAFVARIIPRPPTLGRTGLLVVLLALGGVGAGVAALSRADWRVLDLGPLEAAAIAVALGGAHGSFWYASPFGRRLQQRIPRFVVSAAAVALVVLLLVVGSRVPDSSPTYQAIGDGALGLRWGLKLARTVSDRDGDGFSARFGGGDCDDHKADVYPGAEDVPGNGIDEDCEEGDARAPVEVAEPEPAQAPPPPAKPAAGAFTGNILIITVDTLRADRLGVAGYGRPRGRSLTPTLDALARRGAYFRRVWAQAPNTPRSFPSLVTSRYPSDIAWQQRSLNYSPILPSNQTFFEHLARGGWKPIGIFSHFYFTKERGLGKSFAEWSNDGAGSIAESNKDIASPRIVPRVVARLQKAAASKERFVLWTHLFEPHSSYMDHKEFPSTGKGLAGLEERYDHEIAYVDRWIARIFDTLKETGLERNTAVVVLADHGEAWGEHKRFFHGQDLTEEQLRVPLIVAIPGRTPVVAEDEVALVDVGPTLLELVGVPVPRAFRGRSLLPRIDGKTLPPRPVFAELLPANAWPKHEVMIVDRSRKLTHRISERRYDLHDLRTDPRQQRNLSDESSRRGWLNELKGKLAAFRDGRRQ